VLGEHEVDARGERAAAGAGQVLRGQVRGDQRRGACGVDAHLQVSVTARQSQPLPETSTAR